MGHMLGDAQAAQLLLSCSGAAFAANAGGNKNAHDEFYGSNVKEEVRAGQDSSSKSGWLQPGSSYCSEHAVAVTVPAGSPTSASKGMRLSSKVSTHITPAKRSVKPSPAQQDLHPVLKLGYSTMCEVHCNGLQGLFLGGHDRDLYIQCTSHEYADLPLIDANHGGCIMSCSHFERAAGRELSKKWKESIHVIGEGEGSKATLLAWLKRQADAMSPDIVGSSVWLCWCNEAEYYNGTIVSFNRESGKHKVQYNERFVEELHLPVEKLDFGQGKPVVPAADAVMSHAGPPVARPLLQQDAQQDQPLLTPMLPFAQAHGESAGPASVQAGGSPPRHAEALPYHLLHQSSGTATPSAAADRQTSLRHINTRKRTISISAASPRSGSIQAAVTPGKGRRSARASSGLACAEVLQESGDGMSGLSQNTQVLADVDDPGIPAVPKRMRTGLREPQSLRHAISMPSSGRSTDPYPTSPLAGLASLATATSLAMGGHPSLGAHPSMDSQQPSGLSTGRAFAPPLLGSLSSVQQMCTLSQPPANGLQEVDLTTMSSWMNKVALQLDDVLVDGVHVLAEPVTVAGMVPGSGLRHPAHHGWPSARFQNLLVHARSHGTLQGYYEAMITRYDHFKEKPAALLVKMAEFIMVALTDDHSNQYNDAVHDQHRPSDAQTQPN